MRALLLLSILVVPMVSGAAVYRWVDPDGTVHYSDAPREGAEEVYVPPPQTYPAPKLTPPAPPPPEVAAPAAYTRFELATPANDTTLRDNTGAIRVSFSMKPALKTASGHKLVVLLDGQPQAPVATASTVLENVDRGSHTLQGQIVDGRGNVLISSQSITVHLHRQSINQPNRIKPPSP